MFTFSNINQISGVFTLSQQFFHKNVYHAPSHIKAKAAVLKTLKVYLKRLIVVVRLNKSNNETNKFIAISGFYFQRGSKFRVSIWNIDCKV